MILSAPGICRLIHSTKFSYSNEYDLQRGIEQILKAQGVDVQREVRLGTKGKDRLDFLVSGGIAIEVKIAGSLAAITRQLFRYADQDRVSQLILVTTRTQHRVLPQIINGKPLYIVSLGPF
jgi:hypothetical protein